MKYSWITDPHCNFLSKSDLNALIHSIDCQNSNGLFISGDISTGSLLYRHLSDLAEKIKCPIYFVLGNHDYYHSTFDRVDSMLDSLCAKYPNLKYLSKSEPITLANRTALIGHDGWYDSRWRVPLTKFIFVWDWAFIEDFHKCTDNNDRISLMRDKAQQSAMFIGEQLMKAFVDHDLVYLLTHIPPWPQYRTGSKFNKLFDLLWMPFNSSKVMSDTIKAVMDRVGWNKKLVILAGHTHRERSEQISENIELRVGSASHGKCWLQEPIYL